MDELNIAVVGPVISGVLQAAKSAGLPSKFVPIINVILCLVIAVAVAAPEYNPVATISNWGVLFLAAAGTYEVVGQAVKSKGKSGG